MLIVFGILVILASVILGLIVLVQNPKGGGLSGSLGGFSNQLMGVKQTTDVLEKGTEDQSANDNARDFFSCCHNLLFQGCSK